MCLLLFSGACFAIGYLVESFNIILYGIMLLYVVSLLHCFSHIRRRCILLFLYITFWVFLLSRPTISAFRGDVWWYYSSESTFFALNSIYLSLLSLYFGSLFIEKLLEAKGCYRNEHTTTFWNKCIIQKEHNFNLLRISGIGYYFFFLSTMFIGFEKLSFLQEYGYTSIYTGYTSSVPFLIQIVADFMPYLLCIHLATMPKKYSAYIALGAYVLSSIPILLVGARNNFVLAVIFALLYFIIRDYLDGTKHWMGKFERIALIIACPVAFAFLGAYNYLRDGASFSGNGIIDLIIDLFYKQGVSFDVLCRAYDALPLLPNEVPKLYTFGGFVDYIVHNDISQICFKTISLGEGNNVIKAVYGNSFAHSLAYVIEPNYLAGHGCGSSYLIETYADFGYIGIIIFSFMLGALIGMMIPLFKKFRFMRIVVLCSLTSLFLIPRAEATGWLTFLIDIKFWVILIFCYACANVLTDSSVHTLNISTTKNRGNQYA